jgi:hypothetical protein
MTKEEFKEIVNDYSIDSDLYETYLTLDEINNYSETEKEYLRKTIKEHDIDPKNPKLFVDYIFDLKEEKTKIAVCKYTNNGYGILFFMETQYWDYPAYPYSDFEFWRKIIVEHEKAKREEFDKYIEELAKCKFPDANLKDGYFEIVLSKSEVKDYGFISYFDYIIQIISGHKLVELKERRKLEKEGILKPNIPFLTEKDFESLKKKGNIVFGFSSEKGYMNYRPSLQNGLNVLPGWPFYLSKEPVSWGIEFFDNYPLFYLEDIKKMIEKFSYKRILLP